MLAFVVDTNEYLFRRVSLSQVEICLKDGVHTLLELHGSCL
jgi:hypothetical protein